MPEIELTPTEIYAARKPGSKLTRAIAMLDEARTAAGALGQDVLTHIGVPHLLPQAIDMQKKLGVLRQTVRERVPGSIGQQKWEAENG